MIFDCFTFFNELDLLEIRLNVLNDVVDRFVLVEATRTHQNKPKPLYYSENKERYSAFSDKIIHIVVDEYPSFFAKLRKPNAWDLEKHQRAEIRRGLDNCNPNDIIIVSDLDEIPNPKTILSSKDSIGIKVLKQNNYYYFLNCRSLDESERSWYGPVIAEYGDFRSPQDLRAVSKRMHAGGMRILRDKKHRFFKSLTNPIYKKDISIVDDGGWHFGFLGGVDKIVEKLESFAHIEFNKEELKDREAIRKAIYSGKDILGRGLDCEFVPLDNSYPGYILKNKEKYAHLINPLVK